MTECSCGGFFWAGMTAGAFMALGLIGLVVGLGLLALRASTRRWLTGF